MTLLVLALLLVPASRGAAATADERAAYEKRKALAKPYINDLGPDFLDEETLKTYPPRAREGYRLLLGSGGKRNCQQCHTAARPLNSRFIEPEGANLAEQKLAVARLRAEQPELFADKRVWQIEPGVWRRYIKRMMAKPGCEVSNQDGRKIWEFLVFDGRRKIGENAPAWKRHRLKLIEEMRKLNPARYEEVVRDDHM